MKRSMLAGVFAGAITAGPAVADIPDACRPRIDDWQRTALAKARSLDEAMHGGQEDLASLALSIQAHDEATKEMFICIAFDRRMPYTRDILDGLVPVPPPKRPQAPEAQE